MFILENMQVGSESLNKPLQKQKCLHKNSIKTDILTFDYASEEMHFALPFHFCWSKGCCSARLMNFFCLQRLAKAVSPANWPPSLLQAEHQKGNV